MAAGIVDLPEGYGEVLAELKQQVRGARFQAQRAVNTELIRLYWRIGATLLERAEQVQWGSHIVERLAADLRAEFPEIRGFSRANLYAMRQFATAWPDSDVIVQQPVGRLPWGHITVLLARLSTTELRDWYAAHAAADGWSRAVLEHHITTQAHLRFAAAPTNFTTSLAPAGSDLAQQLTRDPYVFDFLAIDSDANERQLEQAMVDRIGETLRELGNGFAFVGRQVHFEVDGDDFFVDLLFFHVEQLRYVVVELKAGKFKPEYTGQLGFYVALVDDVLRRPAHAPTVGLLLCTDKNDRVVRYALAGSSQPVAVASYDLLPPAEQAALPSEQEIADALGDLEAQ